MSENTQQYPPKNIRLMDQTIEEFREKVFREISARFGLPETELEKIITETARKLSRIMSPEYIGTVSHPVGFEFVDPRHFTRLRNLRIHIFLDVLLDFETKCFCMHELSLMLLEIKELRAVLQRQFNYSWTEHRKHFPLVAQSEV
jgi:hypothetical protein